MKALLKKYCYKIVASLYPCSCNPVPSIDEHEWSSDCLVSDATFKTGLMERVKFLISGKMKVVCVSATENIIGKVEGMTFVCILPPTFTDSLRQTMTVESCDPGKE